MLEINVRDLGAIGDGVADDTSAIQQAINQVMSAGGGTVLFPAGVYLISATLSVTMPFVTLLGPGKLVKKAGTNAITIKIEAPWTVLEGIQIDGNREEQSRTVPSYLLDEVRLESTASYCRIHHCKIENSGGNGIDGLGSSHNIIAYNRIYNCYDNGIFLAFYEGRSADYNQILYNDVELTTKQNGIFITASPGSEPTANYIYHNKIIGNIVKDAGDTCIESGIHAISTIIALNHTMNSRAAAILIRDNLYALVQGNYVDMVNSPPRENDDGIAFYAHHGDKPDSYSLCINNIINGGRYGIHIGGHNHITLHGNAIYNSRAEAIYIAEGHHQISPRNINRGGQVMRGATVPLVQYEDNLVLAMADEIGLVTLEFENGAKKEYALLYVYPEPGSGDGVGYRVIKSSPGISANSDRFEDWGITKEPHSGYVILQRRGSTITGNRPYTLTFAGAK